MQKFAHIHKNDIIYNLVKNSAISVEKFATDQLKMSSEVKMTKKIVNGSVKKYTLVIKKEKFLEFRGYVVWWSATGRSDVGGWWGVNDPYIPTPRATPTFPFFDPFDPDPTPVERTGTNHWDMERAKQSDRIIAKSSRSHTAWSLDFTETVITTYLFLSRSWLSEWLNIGQSRLRRISETLYLHVSSFSTGFFDRVVWPNWFNFRLNLLS